MRQLFFILVLLASFNADSFAGNAPTEIVRPNAALSSPSAAAKGLSPGLFASAGQQKKDSTPGYGDARLERQQSSDVLPELSSQSDYSLNANSDAFGAQLFTGTFARSGNTQFNPDYLITSGDRVQVRLWGGFTFDNVLSIDPQGNIFLPQVGPIKLMGISNKDLQKVVEAAVSKIFRANVFSYTSLADAQPVRVFVGGYVNRPGLYNGTSMDSLLHYLDQAGGIDPERGSFLNVQIKRGEQVRASVSLYDFLLQGRIPLIQLADGDVIFISPRQHTTRVTGLAESTKRFEFQSATLTIRALSLMAKPYAQATHVRVVRNTGTVKNIDYYPLAEADDIRIGNGDEVEYIADKKPGTITVRVEGEHQSAQEYVLPYGVRMASLLKKIQYSERSDKDNLQLFRLSVKERQKRMLQVSLRSLETAALTARSGTSDEARLRKEEAELILQWVERAKKIEPSGQVVIAHAASRDDLLLENGDILRIPTKDGLVLISGEVLFPNAIAYDKSLRLNDYVERAGGYTQNADAARLIVARRDGSFVEAGAKKGFFGFGTSDIMLRSGDEILVLPKIDVKTRQVWKDLTQIIFQLAVSAKVVLGI